MRLKSLCAIGLLFFVLSGCAKEGRYATRAERIRYAREHQIERLPISDVPLEVNDKVIEQMEYYQGGGREHFKRYLERSGRYLDMMQDIFKSEGVPEDLVYLAIVESGFNVHAYSRAHAVGPWQFIGSTGRIYNLKIDSWVDERRDPEMSTRAAARHLKDLYERFEDWYLALAAYNAGPGKVSRAIQKSGTKNFWEIAEGGRKYLRTETRNYVPKYIAATIMAKKPKSFGFNSLNYQEPIDYEKVAVETQTDLEVVAKCADVNVEEIKDLNPHLIRGATPPNVMNYEVKVPMGSADSFRKRYAELPKSERIVVLYHTVKHGETISSIARRYGVSKTMLLSANDIPYSRRNRIGVGKTLVIPKGGAAEERYVKADRSEKESAPTTKKLIYHRIEQGDTLGHIAERYNVPISHIASWNSINKGTTLRAGRKLKIYQPIYASQTVEGDMEGNDAESNDADLSGTDTHRVKYGETLWSISRSYGVSVDDITKLNNLSSARAIKAGQMLAIRKRERVAETVPSRTESLSVNKTHRVESGESIGIIAEKYGIRMAELMAWNNIDDPGKIRTGRVLEIRETNTIARNVANKPQQFSGKRHRVENGEALITIAKMYGVKVEDLMAWNNIGDPRRIRAGQVLVLENKTSQAPSSSEAIKEEKTPGTPLKLSDVSSSAVSAPINYRVKDGDTLWDIARRHGVTISDIQAWNNLSDPSVVKPGDMLAIRK